MKTTLIVIQTLVILALIVMLRQSNADSMLWMDHYQDQNGKLVMWIQRYKECQERK